MFLEIDGLTKQFGGLLAVDRFDMHVGEGEIVGLFGPNGAGKTTFFNLITGVLAPTKGAVRFIGEDITGKKAHTIAKLGISRTFQLNPLFADFSVLENVSTSFHLHPKSSLFDVYFNTRTYRRNEAYIREQADDILKLVGLEEVKGVLAKNLPHGYQKMLGIARALAVRPKLLLLDEPIDGMNPDEIAFTMEGIRKTNEQGTTIVVVEHNMQIMQLCHRVVVMDFGHKIAEGTPEEVRKHEKVIHAYFGGEHAA